MMNAAKNRKRSTNNMQRPPRGKGSDRMSVIGMVPPEGIYSNARFMQVVASLVGAIVRVQTGAGELYEGVFKTFSPLFEVVIEMAHQVDPNSLHVKTDNVVDKLIFKSQDVVYFQFVDVDLEYATRAAGDSFQTDRSISKYNGQLSGEKKLEPWDGSLSDGGDEVALEGDSNGWDPNEMFLKNEQVYGVKSNYDHSLVGYTVPLSKKDTRDYKEAEAKAARIANEIENNPAYQAHIDLENDDDERQLDGCDGKYLPPARRNKNMPPVRMVRSSTLPVPPPPHKPPPSSNSMPSMPRPLLPPPAPRMGGPPGTLNAGPPPHHMHYNTHPPAQANVNLGPPRVNGVETRTEHRHAEAANNNNTRTDPLPQREPRHVERCPQLVGSSNQHPPTPVVVEVKEDAQDRRGHKSVDREETLSGLRNFHQNFKMVECEDEDKHVPPPTTYSHPPPVRTQPPRHSPPQPPRHSPPQPSITPISPQEDKTDDIEKLNSTLKKSTLNPNAKEFVFNPNAKSFTPRCPSTPPPPRPRTPQTPQQPQLVAGPPMHTPMSIMQTMLPTYVVASQAPYSMANNSQGGRHRKAVPMAMQHRGDIVSPVQVAAATGQPLMAPPSLPTAQFTMPYPPHQGALIHQSTYHQMMRMVTPQNNMVPVMTSGMGYSHDGQPQPQLTQAVYMAPPPNHHPPHHPPPPHPNPAPSPAQHQQNPSQPPTPSNTGPPPLPSAPPGHPPPPSSYPPPHHHNHTSYPMMLFSPQQIPPHLLGHQSLQSGATMTLPHFQYIHTPAPGGQPPHLSAAVIPHSQ